MPKLLVDFKVLEVLDQVESVQYIVQYCVYVEIHGVSTCSVKIYEHNDEK